MAERLVVSKIGTRVDKTAVHGATEGLEFVFTDPSTKAPMNMAGWSGEVTFMDGPTAIMVLSTANGGLTLDGSGNIKTSAFAQTVPWDYAEFQCRVVSAQNTVYYPFWGTYTLKDAFADNLTNGQVVWDAGTF